MSHAKRNWSQYNKSLVNRGSLTLWIDKDSLKKPLIYTRKVGRPSFSSAIIQTGLILKSVYRLTYRALQGFLNSVLSISPNYTLFCKRAREVAADLPKLSKRRPKDLVIDSSGLKIYGEGEWKVKIHGRSKKRRWMKIHIAVDPASQELIAVKITDDSVGDSRVLPSLVEASPKSVKSVFADGAYDRLSCRRFLHNRGIKQHIPPGLNATFRPEIELKSRNQDLAVIKGLGGDKRAKSLWKKLTGYYRRSLAETAFSRLKRMFGDKLKSRKIENQVAEAMIHCQALNRMANALNIN